MPRLKWGMMKTPRDADRMAVDAKLVIFGKHTPWWTFNEADCLKHPATGRDSDPRGGELLEVHDPRRWMENARAAAAKGAYGPFGMRAFMACYHGNVVLTEGDVPQHLEKVGHATCVETFALYTQLLRDAGEHEQKPDSTLYVFARTVSNIGNQITTAPRAEQLLVAVDPRFDLWNHSPDGFGWGYAGSGAAQSALAILADFLGDPEEAQRHHQRFKFDVIAGHPEDAWQLTGKEIREWYERRIAT